MVTALTSTKATAARFTTGPVVFLALFLLLAQTGRVASYPGEVVFEEDEEKKCSAPEPHCVTVAHCPQAQRDIRRGRHPTICDWKGATSLVCCAQPTALPPVTPNQPYPPTEVPSPNPPVEPPVGPPVEPPLEPPIQPPTVVPPVVPPEPQPKPPTDQGTGTTTEQGASGTRGPSSDGNAGSSGTKPDGTSEGREPTAADEDCECDDALPVRTCGLRPEATESRQRPARLLLDEPVYSLDARRVRRPGLSRRRPLNAVSLLPRQQLTGQSQQQQQRQQQQSSSSDSTWPWMASVVDQVNPARRCAGVLLDQQHVLTAAQCFGPDNGRNSAVMLNTPGLPVTLRHVVSVEAHPMFRVPDGYHDLALVRFEPALASGELAPICLPTVLNARRVLNGSVLDAVSWSNRQRDFHPGSMGEKRYQVISASSCNNTYAGVDLSPYPQGINHDDFICTQLTTNVGEECVGIPGSPLMVKDGSHWTVIGMYSFGVSCSGTAQYPTVFTRVSPYVTWIYERLGLRR